MHLNLAVLLLWRSQQPTTYTVHLRRWVGKEEVGEDGSAITTEGSLSSSTPNYCAWGWGWENGEEQVGERRNICWFLHRPCPFFSHIFNLI